MNPHPNIRVRRIRAGWYEYRNAVTGDRMGLRRHSGGAWGAYFRDKNGQGIKGTPPGEELPIPSREAGERLAMRELTEA